MKILSASQVRAADQFTIENEPIASIDLMERASKAFVEKFLELFVDKRPVAIFCGTGNNGGDGLAIGRILVETGWEVSIYVLGKTGSEDFEKNLSKAGDCKILTEPSDFPSLQANQLVIDGLFGSGLSRPIEGIASQLIQYLNSQSVVRISIDIASGVYADQAMEKNAIALKPAYTISFQIPKLTFFHPYSEEYTGKWYVVDIGLDQKFIDNQKSVFAFSEEKELRGLLPQRPRFAHKSQVGKLLIVAGSHGKMGAAALCAKAALRAGIGLTSVQVPKCGIDIMQTLVPEAMVISDEDKHHISVIEGSGTTVAVGPGIETKQITKTALADFLDLASQPLVLDADALNILSEDKDLLSRIPPESILTPHPGEFRRLVGEWKDDFEKLEVLRSFCMKYSVNVVLKGAYSAVCCSGGDVFFNPTGNPGMATAGSGDVLTGIVASFLAQGLRPFDALRLGVYIHGLAGDLAVEEIGQNSLIASDIISYISNSFNRKSV